MMTILVIKLFYMMSCPNGNEVLGLHDNREVYKKYQNMRDIIRLLLFEFLSGLATSLLL